MDKYFNSYVVGIVEVDDDEKIVRVNPGICKMLGYTEDEFLRWRWVDVVHPEDISRTKEHFKQLFERGRPGIVLNVRFRTKSGVPLDAALNVQIENEPVDGRPGRYIGFVMDISRQVQAEREAAAANRRTQNLHNKIGRALGDALHSRDPYSAEHQDHVARRAFRIAEILDLPLMDRQAIGAAAGVHDIGKIAIPNEYLTKTTKLLGLEREVVRTHAERGYEILLPMQTEFPVAEIVFQHHERLDGSGYPRGLRNGAILREAQIIAAADTADSILKARPYRRALGKDFAIAELKRERTTRLAEDIVDACILSLGSGPDGVDVS